MKSIHRVCKLPPNSVFSFFSLYIHVQSVVYRKYSVIINNTKSQKIMPLIAWPTDQVNYKLDAHSWSESSLINSVVYLEKIHLQFPVLELLSRILQKKLHKRRISRSFRHREKEIERREKREEREREGGERERERKKERETLISKMLRNLGRIV